MPIEDVILTRCVSHLTSSSPQILTNSKELDKRK
jgi:hypothetical protein